MIFGVLKLEDKVQIGDKTRLDANSTYLSPDEGAITLLRISPDNGVTFFDVTNDKYLDWQFGTEQLETIILEVTTATTAATTFSGTISVLAAATENLFSNDNDLVEYEDDVLRYIRSGRNSFIDKHRVAQTEILDELDQAKVWKRDGSRYVASDLVDIQDFKQWSRFLTLKIIYEGISNAIGDVFEAKSVKYGSMAIKAKERGVLRLDVNGDGVIEDFEKVDMMVGTMRRG